MSKNEPLPPGLLTYKVSTDPDPLYINDPDSKLLIKIEKNTAVYLDKIFIEVPADSGSSADTLFLTDPPLTYQMTPENHWEIKGPNIIIKPETPPTQTFTISPKGEANQITEDLHVTITGTTNTDKGTVQIVIGEHSGTSSGHYAFRESKFSVKKSEPMPFHLHSFLSFDPHDPDTPKLSFKTTDEIHLSWDSNGTSYELFPKDLVTKGNPTTNTHITIPAGNVPRDQTVVIKATDGDKTLYQTLNICIENPVLTPTKSLISGKPGENSLQVNNGNAVIDGDALFVTSNTVFDTNEFGIVSRNDKRTAKFELTDQVRITGNLYVGKDESGNSKTILNELTTFGKCDLAATSINGKATILGPVEINNYSSGSTDTFKANVPVLAEKTLEVADTLTANGQFNIAGTSPVTLCKSPVQLITELKKESGTYVAKLTVQTSGYLMIPEITDNQGLSGFELKTSVLYKGQHDPQQYTYQWGLNDAPTQLPPNPNLIIPLNPGATVDFTFSITFTALPGRYLNYHVFWMPMGGGGTGNESGYSFTEPHTKKTAENREGDKYHQEHLARVEERNKRPEKALSFINDLQEAFGQTLSPDQHAALAKSLEALL
ncbi:MAG: hypothetical protein HEP71_33055 [Roseivirga sp.]|nr:hypothetical protein [Roseivirga sp.]